MSYEAVNYWIMTDFYDGSWFKNRIEVGEILLEIDWNIFIEVQMHGGKKSWKHFQWNKIT